MSERQKHRPTDRQKDRQKTERLFSLVIKTKVVQNVNWMSERWKKIEPAAFEDPKVYTKSV